MATHLETKLEIKSWDEQPYRELPDGRKFARADVVLVGTEDDLAAEGGFESLLYYSADGTSSFVTLLHLSGRLGDHSGSFVLEGSGTYDGTTAKMALTVVPGSGTDELAGLSGAATSESTQDNYPHMPLTLDYEIQ